MTELEMAQMMLKKFREAQEQSAPEAISVQWPVASLLGYLVPGTKWRHQKSQNIYTILTVSRMEATGCMLVSYRRREEDVTWTRPLEDFTALVEVVVDSQGHDLHGRVLKTPRFVPAHPETT